MLGVAESAGLHGRSCHGLVTYGCWDVTIYHIRVNVADLWDNRQTTEYILFLRQRKELNVCVCMHAHMCVCMHTHVCMCVHACMYVCVTNRAVLVRMAHG